MKEFIFVSDFDGTITKIDFYKIILDRYLQGYGVRISEEWKQGRYTDIEYLSLIYQSANRTQDQLMQDILSIELDNYLETFIKNIQNSDGDFLILSGGTSYYIERLLDYKGIKNIPIISNKGIFKNNGIHILLDKENKYYSDYYGIDKTKVISDLKAKYGKVYFAGNSNPDVAPAKHADITFATGKLIELLSNVGIPFISFENLKDIENSLISKGIVKINS